jgi:transcriptional regulator with XRE-family HTH domain
MASSCYKLHTMDYELASRELVRALRGERSQAATQRRLKRRSNVLHAWETGARYPRATDLLQLLQVTGRSPPAILNRLAPCRGSTPRALVSSWLNALVRDRSQAELARQLGMNRNTVARWLSGDTEPRLPQLLALLEATTQRALDFLALLVEPSGLPSLAAAQADLQQQRSLAYGQPWAHAVLRALELEEYRSLPQHEPAVLARSVGISVAEAERCLAALLRAKQVRRRGGRYRVGRVLSVDTRHDPAGNLALKRHWFALTSERLARAGIPEHGLASYNLFAISDADLDRVRQAHLDYYERVRAIVAESKQPTRVVLTTIGLLPLASA